jgi:hypothetical protein
LTSEDRSGAALRGGARSVTGHPYKPNTIVGVEARLRLHVLPFVGGIPRTALRRGDVRRMVDELLAERGPTVEAHARDALRLVLRLQLERETIDVNVATGVRAPAHACCVSPGF